MVPKIKEANTIKQYRPICLLNVDYKGITNALTVRFSPVAGKLIGEMQSGFLEERNILEGVLILHEVVHELERSGRKGLILKIDFEKAYDRVRWDFLKEVMNVKGLPDEWISWVVQTVQVNGHRGKYFRTFLGLRQGDPLSPLMFN